MRCAVFLIPLCAIMLSCRSRSTVERREYSDTLSIDSSSMIRLESRRTFVYDISDTIILDSIEIHTPGGARINARRGCVRRRTLSVDDIRVESCFRDSLRIDSKTSETSERTPATSRRFKLGWMLLAVFGFFCVTLWRKH